MPFARWSVNVSGLGDGELTPHRLVYGKAPRDPLDLVWGAAAVSGLRSTSRPEYLARVRQMFRCLRDTYRVLRDIRAQRMKYLVTPATPQWQRIGDTSAMGRPRFRSEYPPPNGRLTGLIAQAIEPTPSDPIGRRVSASSCRKIHQALKEVPDWGNYVALHFMTGCFVAEGKTLRQALPDYVSGEVATRPTTPAREGSEGRKDSRIPTGPSSDGLGLHKKGLR